MPCFTIARVWAVFITHIYGKYNSIYIKVILTYTIIVLLWF